MGEHIGELAYAALLESGALKAENATLRAQVADLRREIEAVRQDRNRAHLQAREPIRQAEQERDEARAESARLREALEPFVREFGPARPDWGMDYPLSPGSGRKLYMRDYIRAEAALATPPAVALAEIQAQAKAQGAADERERCCEVLKRPEFAAWNPESELTGATVNLMMSDVEAALRALPVEPNGSEAV